MTNSADPDKMSHYIWTLHCVQRYLRWPIGIKSLKSQIILSQNRIVSVDVVFLGLVLKMYIQDAIVTVI